MLVRYFRQNQPAALALLLPLFLLLWPGSRPVPDPMGQVAPGMPAFLALRSVFASIPWTLPLTGGVLVLGMAVQLAHMLNESELFERRNHLPALLLPLLLALFPQGLTPDPSLAGTPFVLWAMHRLWGVQGRSRVLGPLFDAGLLIGIASAFYLPFVFLVVVIWSSLAVMRPFHWREHVMPVLGAGAVLFIVWGGLHLCAPAVWDLDASLRPEAPAVRPPAVHWLQNVLLSAVAVAFTAIAIVVFAAGYARGVMREKNTRASFLAFTFAFALLAFYNWTAEGRVPPILIAAPMAVFLAWPLLLARRIGWAEAGVWAILLLGAWGRWG